MTPTINKTAVKLPPRPQPRTAPVPAKAVEKYGFAGDVKAVAIRIELLDGTVLSAKDGHATDIYNYLIDCERYCASRPGCVSTYLGPQLVRTDAKGRVVVEGMAK